MKKTIYRWTLKRGTWTVFRFNRGGGGGVNKKEGGGVFEGAGEGGWRVDTPMHTMNSLATYIKNL